MALVLEARLTRCWLGPTDLGQLLVVLGPEDSRRIGISYTGPTVLVPDEALLPSLRILFQVSTAEHHDELARQTLARVTNAHLRCSQDC